MSSEFEVTGLCDGFDATYEEDDDNKSFDSHRDREKDGDRSKDRKHGRGINRRRQERGSNRSRRHRDGSGRRDRSPINCSDDRHNSGDDERIDGGCSDRIQSKDLDNQLSEEKSGNKWVTIQSSRTIILRNLTPDVDEKIIGAELMLLGLPFKDIRLNRRASGVSRGFAFVEFHNISDAQRWMEQTQSSVLLPNHYWANMAYSVPSNRDMVKDSNLQRNDRVCIKCLGHIFKHRDYCYNCNLPCKDLTSQSITTAASTPATSDRQPAAPLASTATSSDRQPAAPLASTVTSYRQSTESVQPADEAQLKSVLDRIAVIEEAVYSFRSRTEKVAEQQSGIDQQLKELASKLSESEKGIDQQLKELASRLSESDKGIDQQLKELASRLSESDKGIDQQVKELASKLSESEKGIDQQLKELASRLSESDKGIDQQVKELASKLSESEKGIDQQLKELASKLSESDKGIDQQLKGLASRLSESDKGIDQQLKELASRLPESDKGIDQVKELASKLSESEKGIDQQLKELASRLSELDKGIDQQLKELASRLSESDKGIDQQLKELASRLSESDKGIDQQVKELASKLSESEKGIDQQLQGLASKLSESDKGIDQQLKELASRLSESDKGIDQQLKELTSRLSESDKGIDQRVKELASRLSESDKGIDQQVKELASRLSESEKGIDKQIKELTSRLSESEKGIDQQLKELASRLSESDKGIDQQLKELASKLSESDKKHSSRFKQIKQQISDVSETRDAIEKEQKTKLRSLEKQLQKISTAQNKLKTEMESQADLAEKLVHVPNLLKSVKEHVDALDARIDDIIDDCSDNQEDIETVKCDLADKVMANTQSVQVISEGQDKITTLMKQLETQLQTMEADSRINVKDVQKQVEKGESNFRILCQKLNDQLRPLEQLRTCLKEQASMRGDVTKLSQLHQEVAVMSPRLQQLELKSSRTRCGFRAWTFLAGEVADNTIIRLYETTNCNVGENFNTNSGVFTAPVHGLYVASISLHLRKDENVSVGVEYKQSLDQESSTSVCQSSAATKQTSTCGVGVVDMKAGEVLFSRVYSMEMNTYLKEVYFSCFLLG